METMICIAETHNCAANLAGEAYLMGLKRYQRILYLWENNPCIVIGRFQNPYSECNLANMDKDGVLLVRRNSGGGAVYHDRGNICFTFIGDRETSCKEENFAIVTQALANLGIETELSGRNDIVTSGRKISGNAFQNTKDRYCHHGTLLVSSDLGVMGRYLTPSLEKLRSKAVKSVQSRVGNLQQIRKDITTGLVREAFIKAFEQHYGKGPIVSEDFSTKKETRQLASQFSDRQAILEKTPSFSQKLVHRFPWGEVTLHLEVQRGYIERARAFSDCLDTALVPTLETLLSNIWYKKEEILSLRGKEKDQQVQEVLDFLVQALS